MKLDNNIPIPKEVANIIDLINSDEPNIKTCVISLDDYIGNYNRQKPHLEKLGLIPYRFSGVNAIKDEHMNPNYNSYISKFAYNFTPRTVIGCSLSHILCNKHIYDNFINTNNNNNNTSSSCRNKLPYFLIMEDDAFPIVSKAEFYKELNNSINEITLLDPEWDIIQLHSDAFFPTNTTYITHYATGSTAAYLISKSGIEKTIKSKVYSHADFIQHNFIKFKKYRTKTNLFYTEEKNSANRVTNTSYKNLHSLSIAVKAKILEKINKNIVGLPLRGEKEYANFFEFPIFKLPYLKKEYTVNEVIDYLVLFALAKRTFSHII